MPNEQVTGLEYEDHNMFLRVYRRFIAIATRYEIQISSGGDSSHEIGMLGTMLLILQAMDQRIINLRALQNAKTPTARQYERNIEQLQDHLHKVVIERDFCQNKLRDLEKRYQCEP